MGPFRVVLLAIVALALWPASVFGQELPPGPSTIHPLGRTPLGQEAGRIEETQSLILDFAPAAWTPLHSHGGLTVVRVLEGEMTRRRGGVEDRFKAGEGWVETSGDVHAAGNAAGTPARVLVTFLLSKGAPLTTVAGAATQNAPPGPTTAFQSKRVAVSNPTTNFAEAATTVLGFAPGAWTPQHSHAGLTLVAVVEGEMRVRSRGRETVYQAGDVWIEEPRDVHAAGNTTTSPARVAVTFVQLPGDPVTTIAPTPAAAQAPAPAPAQAPSALAGIDLVPASVAVVAASAAALLGAAVYRRRRTSRA